MDITGRELDAALGTARDKAETAEVAFASASRPPASLAAVVERRVEDLHEMSLDAVSYAVSKAQASPSRRRLAIGVAIAAILVAWLARRLGPGRANPWKVP